MIIIDLLADTNVISYMFEKSPLCSDYQALIGDRRTGLTLHTLAELHYGVAYDQWSQRKIDRLDTFLSAFYVVPVLPAIAAICGNVRAQRRRVGQAIDPTDAWIAATALWYGVPLVTHDWDFEAIPGLEVLTLHKDWCVRDSCPTAYEEYDALHAFHSKQAILRADFPHPPA